MRPLLFVTLFSVFAFCGVANAQGLQYAPTSPGASANELHHDLIVEAKLTEKGSPIERGLTWRIFGNVPGADGKLPLVAASKGGTSSFSLPAGTYLVHAAFGRAGATKRVSIGGTGISETFVLDAGGLQLSATAEGKEIPAKHLRFSIYGIDKNEENERELIAQNIAADRIVRLSTGVYHVVSYYGKINATIRADLEVNAGEVTKAVLQHRGAEIRLKLVSKAGGVPVANTAWTVLAEQGAKVFESQSNAPSLVLAEGRYEASVRNGDEVYVHNFEVKAGQNADVEVLLK